MDCKTNVDVDLFGFIGEKPYCCPLGKVLAVGSLSVKWPEPERRR